MTQIPLSVYTMPEKDKALQEPSSEIKKSQKENNFEVCIVAMNISGQRYIHPFFSSKGMQILSGLVTQLHPFFNMLQGNELEYQKEVNMKTQEER